MTDETIETLPRWKPRTFSEQPAPCEDCEQLAAEFKQLRRIIAFYGIEIMPDGSFTSPRITQNEVDLKQLREFVGAIDTISSIGWHGYWSKAGRGFMVYDMDGNLIATGTDPFDAWQKIKGESK